MPGSSLAQQQLKIHCETAPKKIDDGWCDLGPDCPYCAEDKAFHKKHSDEPKKLHLKPGWLEENIAAAKEVEFAPGTYLTETAYIPTSMGQPDLEAVTKAMLTNDDMQDDPNVPDFTKPYVPPGTLLDPDLPPPMPELVEIQYVCELAQTLADPTPQPVDDDDLNTIKKVLVWANWLMQQSPQSNKHKMLLALDTLEELGIDITPSGWGKNFEKMMAISTVHVTQEVANKIDFACAVVPVADNPLHKLIIYPHGQSGWLFAVPLHWNDGAAFNDIPHCLWQAINLASKCGAQWLLIDADADKNSCLAEYNLEGEDG